MKKLKLKFSELGATEVLTRAQLKNVLGGGGDGSNNGSGGTSFTCICRNGQEIHITTGSQSEALAIASQACLVHQVADCYPG